MASNVVQVDFRRGTVTSAALAVAPARPEPAIATVRCAGCAHWVPGETSGQPGRCFGHHGLPRTNARESCSVWRRRRLRSVP